MKLSYDYNQNDFSSVQGLADAQDGMKGRASSLVSRNVSVCGHRTSVRLEPEMWQALKDIARRENCTVHVLCSLIQTRKRADSSLTAAIRVFVMLYFRAASTEEGHVKAGHGMIARIAAKAGVLPGRLARRIGAVFTPNEPEPALQAVGI